MSTYCKDWVSYRFPIWEKAAEWSEATSDMRTTAELQLDVMFVCTLCDLIGCENEVRDYVTVCCPRAV